MNTKYSHELPSFHNSTFNGAFRYRAEDYPSAVPNAVQISHDNVLAAIGQQILFLSILDHSTSSPQSPSFSPPPSTQAYKSTTSSNLAHQTHQIASTETNFSPWAVLHTRSFPFLPIDFVSPHTLAWYQNHLKHNANDHNSHLALPTSPNTTRLPPPLPALKLSLPHQLLLLATPDIFQNNVLFRNSVKGIPPIGPIRKQHAFSSTTDPTDFSHATIPWHLTFTSPPPLSKFQHFTQQFQSLSINNGFSHFQHLFWQMSQRRSSIQYTLPRFTALQWSPRGLFPSTTSSCLLAVQTRLDLFQPITSLNIFAPQTTLASGDFSRAPLIANIRALLLKELQKQWFDAFDMIKVVKLELSSVAKRYKTLESLLNSQSGQFGKQIDKEEEIASNTAVKREFQPHVEQIRRDANGAKEEAGKVKDELEPTKTHPTARLKDNTTKSTKDRKQNNEILDELTLLTKRRTCAALLSQKSRLIYTRDLLQHRLAESLHICDKMMEFEAIAWSPIFPYTYSFTYTPPCLSGPFYPHTRHTAPIIVSGTVQCTFLTIGDSAGNVHFFLFPASFHPDKSAVPFVSNLTPPQQISTQFKQFKQFKQFNQPHQQHSQCTINHSTHNAPEYALLSMAMELNISISNYNHDLIPFFYTLHSNLKTRTNHDLSPILYRDHVDSIDKALVNPALEEATSSQGLDLNEVGQKSPQDAQKTDTDQIGPQFSNKISTNQLMDPIEMFLSTTSISASCVQRFYHKHHRFPSYVNLGEQLEETIQNNGKKRNSSDSSDGEDPSTDHNDDDDDNDGDATFANMDDTRNLRVLHRFSPTNHPASTSDSLLAPFPMYFGTLLHTRPWSCASNMLERSKATTHLTTLPVLTSILDQLFSDNLYSHQNQLINAHAQQSSQSSKTQQQQHEQNESTPQNLEPNSNSLSNPTSTSLPPPIASPDPNPLHYLPDPIAIKPTFTSLKNINHLPFSSHDTKVGGTRSERNTRIFIEDAEYARISKRLELDPPYPRILSQPAPVLRPKVSVIAFCPQIQSIAPWNTDLRTERHDLSRDVIAMKETFDSMNDDGGIVNTHSTTSPNASAVKSNTVSSTPITKTACSLILPPSLCPLTSTLLLATGTTQGLVYLDQIQLPHLVSSLSHHSPPQTLTPASPGAGNMQFDDNPFQDAHLHTHTVSSTSTLPTLFPTTHLLFHINHVSNLIDPLLLSLPTLQRPFGYKSQLHHSPQFSPNCPPSALRFITWAPFSHNPKQSSNTNNIHAVQTSSANSSHTNTPIPTHQAYNLITTTRDHNIYLFTLQPHLFRSTKTQSATHLNQAQLPHHHSPSPTTISSPNFAYTLTPVTRPHTLAFEQFGQNPNLFAPLATRHIQGIASILYIPGFCPLTALRTSSNSSTSTKITPSTNPNTTTTLADHSSPPQPPINQFISPTSYADLLQHELALQTTIQSTPLPAFLTPIGCFILSGLEGGTSLIALTRKKRGSQTTYYLKPQYFFSTQHLDVDYYHAALSRHLNPIPDHTDSNEPNNSNNQNIDAIHSSPSSARKSSHPSTPPPNLPPELKSDQPPRYTFAVPTKSTLFYQQRANLPLHLALSSDGLSIFSHRQLLLPFDEFYHTSTYPVKPSLITSQPFPTFLTLHKDSLPEAGSLEPMEYIKLFTINGFANHSSQTSPQSRPNPHHKLLAGGSSIADGSDLSGGLITGWFDAHGIGGAGVLEKSNPSHDDINTMTDSNLNNNRPNTMNMDDIDATSNTSSLTHAICSTVKEEISNTSSMPHDVMQVTYVSTDKDANNSGQHSDLTPTSSSTRLIMSNPLDNTMSDTTTPDNNADQPPSMSNSREDPLHSHLSSDDEYYDNMEGADYPRRSVMVPISALPPQDQQDKGKPKHSLFRPIYPTPLRSATSFTAEIKHQVLEITHMGQVYKLPLNILSSMDKCDQLNLLSILDVALQDKILAEMCSNKYKREICGKLDTLLFSHVSEILYKGVNFCDVIGSPDLNTSETVIINEDTFFPAEPSPGGMSEVQIDLNNNNNNIPNQNNFSPPLPIAPTPQLFSPDQLNKLRIQFDLYKSVLSPDLFHLYSLFLDDLFTLYKIALFAPKHAPSTFNNAHFQIITYPQHAQRSLRDLEHFAIFHNDTISLTPSPRHSTPVNHIAYLHNQQDSLEFDQSQIHLISSIPTPQFTPNLFFRHLSYIFSLRHAHYCMFLTTVNLMFTDPFPLDSNQDPNQRYQPHTKHSSTWGSRIWNRIGINPTSPQAPKYPRIKQQQQQGQLETDNPKSSISSRRSARSSTKDIKSSAKNKSSITEEEEEEEEEEEATSVKPKRGRDHSTVKTSLASFLNKTPSNASKHSDATTEVKEEHAAGDNVAQIKEESQTVVEQAPISSQTGQRRSIRASQSQTDKIADEMNDDTAEAKSARHTPHRQPGAKKSSTNGLKKGRKPKKVIDESDSQFDLSSDTVTSSDPDSQLNSASDFESTPKRKTAVKRPKSTKTAAKPRRSTKPRSKFDDSDDDLFDGAKSGSSKHKSGPSVVSLAPMKILPDIGNGFVTKTSTRSRTLRFCWNKAMNAQNTAKNTKSRRASSKFRDSSDDNSSDSDGYAQYQYDDTDVDYTVGNWLGFPFDLTQPLCYLNFDSFITTPHESSNSLLGLAHGIQTTKPQPSSMHPGSHDDNASPNTAHTTDPTPHLRTPIVPTVARTLVTSMLESTSLFSINKIVFFVYHFSVLSLPQLHDIWSPYPSNPPNPQSSPQTAQNQHTDNQIAQPSQNQALFSDCSQLYTQSLSLHLLLTSPTATLIPSHTSLYSMLTTKRFEYSILRTTLTHLMSLHSNYIFPTSHSDNNQLFNRQRGQRIYELVPSHTLSQSELLTKKQRAIKSSFQLPVLLNQHEGAMFRKQLTGAGDTDGSTNNDVGGQNKTRTSLNTDVQNKPANQDAIGALLMTQFMVSPNLHQSHSSESLQNLTELEQTAGFERGIADTILQFISRDVLLSQTFPIDSDSAEQCQVGQHSAPTAMLSDDDQHMPFMLNADNLLLNSAFSALLPLFSQCDWQYTPTMVLPHHAPTQTSSMTGIQDTQNQDKKFDKFAVKMVFGNSIPITPRNSTSSTSTTPHDNHIDPLTSLHSTFQTTLHMLIKGYTNSILQFFDNIKTFAISYTITQHLFPALQHLLHHSHHQHHPLASQSQTPLIPAISPQKFIFGANIAHILQDIIFSPTLLSHQNRHFATPFITQPITPSGPATTLGSMTTQSPIDQLITSLFPPNQTHTNPYTPTISPYHTLPHILPLLSLLTRITLSSVATLQQLQLTSVALQSKLTQTSSPTLDSVKSLPFLHKVAKLIPITADTKFFTPFFSPTTKPSPTTTPTQPGFSACFAHCLPSPIIELKTRYQLLSQSSLLASAAFLPQIITSTFIPIYQYISTLLHLSSPQQPTQDISSPNLPILPEIQPINTNNNNNNNNNNKLLSRFSILFPIAQLSPIAYSINLIADSRFIANITFLAKLSHIISHFLNLKPHPTSPTSTILNFLQLMNPKTPNQHTAASIDLLKGGFPGLRSLFPTRSFVSEYTITAISPPNSSIHQLHPVSCDTMNDDDQTNTRSNPPTTAHHHLASIRPTSDHFSDMLNVLLSPPPTPFHSSNQLVSNPTLHQSFVSPRTNTIFHITAHLSSSLRGLDLDHLASTSQPNPNTNLQLHNLTAVRLGNTPRDTNSSLLSHAALLNSEALFTNLPRLNSDNPNPNSHHNNENEEFTGNLLYPQLIQTMQCPSCQSPLSTINTHSFNPIHNIELNKHGLVEGNSHFVFNLGTFVTPRDTCWTCCSKSR